MPTTVIDPVASSIQIPVSDLLVDDVQITTQIAAVQEVTINEGEGMHDSATITLKFASTRMDSYIDKPVSFTFGPRNGFGRFFGYVSNVVPSRNYRADLTMTFECLGLTWVMRAGQPRYMKNRTVTQAINEVVAPYHIGTFIDEFKMRDRPYTWPTFAQTSETDFEFIVDAAHRVGFPLFVNDGVIRVVDPIKTLKNAGVFVTLVKGDDVNDASRTMLDFNPTTQSLLTRATQSLKFGFFASDDTAVVSSMDAAMRLETDVGAVDQIMADVYAAAWNNTPSSWSQQCTVRIMGNAKIQPGMLVATQISGSPVIRNDYDGVWLVTGLTHTLTPTAFQSLLTLSRTPVLRIGTSDYQQWFQASQRARPVVQRRVMPDKSVRWESSWAGLFTEVTDTPQTSVGFDWRAG